MRLHSVLNNVKYIYTRFSSKESYKRQRISRYLICEYKGGQEVRIILRSSDSELYLKRIL